VPTTGGFDARAAATESTAGPCRGCPAGIVAVALVLGGLGLTGCGVAKTVGKVEREVEANRGTIDTFTNKMKSGEATTFEATYATNGGSATTVVYAVEPPKGLVFQEMPSGAGTPSVDIIVNSSGEYSCTPPSTSGSRWSCEKLDAADTITENKIFDLYTPAHWTTFLQDFSLAAGFAGDKVSSSTMSVNGFSMDCVDFVASGVPGTSAICTTAQGILGYVRVASDTTDFEIKSYSASPPASLFRLPPGAMVTTPPTSTT
jgi:hypothetical protein